MLIDWPTVVFQIINFLLLLLLLRWVLYRPVLKTLDKRQEQLANRWQAAQVAKDQAEAETQACQKAQQDLEGQRQRILAATQAEATAAHQQQLQEMRAALDQQRQDWRQALRAEQQHLLTHVQQQFGHEVIAIARHILQDLAHTDLEQQAIQVFQQRLIALDEDTRQAMAVAFAQSPQGITIQTSGALSTADQDRLCQALREARLLTHQTVQFAAAPDLIFGIRLQNEAYDLTWSAADYLQDLEKAVQQALLVAGTAAIVSEVSS